MKDKLKVWEIAAMAAAVWGALISGWLWNEQQQLAEGMIRLHVVANSNRAEDQALKLAVRDRVLEQTAALWPEGAGPEQAQALLRENLAAIEAAGREAVQAWGREDPVTAQIGT